MSRLHQALADYLSVRRAMGYKLERTGKLLVQFVDYLDDAEVEIVTIEHCLAWATLPAAGSINWHAHRLSVVRGFATWLSTIDPATEVPPTNLLPPERNKRATPYLYSQDELAALLAATSILSTPLRTATYATLLALIAVTGLRVGEAIRLDRADLDLRAGLLMVRSTKFGKDRQVPLHPTTTTALVRYLKRRERLFPQPATSAVFISTAGTRLRYCNVSWTFLKLVDHAGLTPRSPSCRPRIHDLRHSFAVNTVRWLPHRRGRPSPAAAAVHLPRPRPPRQHLLVSLRRARTARAGWRPPAGALGSRPMSLLAPTLQAFFTDRLLRQRQASPNTIAAYRDAFKLLLAFVSEQGSKEPSQVDVADLDATKIAAFLDHLEHDRGNSVSTRNARLAAIRSLFRFAALRHPEHAASIQRVLAIPPKRCNRALIDYLSDPEIDALLAAPDPASWTGRRDHALLMLAIQTGLRLSELTGLTCGDVHLGTGAHVACHGKGRKDRITPMTRETVDVLQGWLAERAGQPNDPLFPSRRGTRLSRDAIERRLAIYTARASGHCPTLHGKKISAHVLRHTAAMRLLHAGIDTSVIALWLGHEQVETTQIYLHADLTLKERAIARITPPTSVAGRYRPPDAILSFLDSL